jgi:hypothetical protein
MQYQHFIEYIQSLIKINDIEKHQKMYIQSA